MYYFFILMSPRLLKKLQGWFKEQRITASGSTKNLSGPDQVRHGSSSPPPKKWRACLACSPHSIYSQRSAVCKLIRINFSGAVGMMGHKNFKISLQKSSLFGGFVGPEKDRLCLLFFSSTLMYKLRPGFSLATHQNWVFSVELHWTSEVGLLL